MQEFPIKIVVLYGSEFTLIALSAIILIICLFFLVECVAAVLPKVFPTYKGKWENAKVTVLIPAHNEEIAIASTLNQIIPVLKQQDSLVVVADNCTDKTAEIARTMGATVIEREDSIHKGKGYALDYGLQFIAAEPPEVVVMIDADCNINPDTIEQLTECAIATNRPVQGKYLMVRANNSESSKDFISQFSNIIRNFVRPLGLKHLGISAPLLGAGMAFPWLIIRSVNIASGNLLEDIKLGLDLSVIGHNSIFYPQATVTAYLPSSLSAAKSQKTRWIHGYLQLIQSYIPMLFKQAVHQRRLDLLLIIFDLCIPPLTLLVMIWLGLTTISLIFAVLQISAIPAMISFLAGLCLFTALTLAWVKFASTSIPLSKLLTIPLYIFWKIPVYIKFIVSPQTAWIRTERE